MSKLDKTWFSILFLLLILLFAGCRSFSQEAPSLSGESVPAPLDGEYALGLEEDDSVTEISENATQVFFEGQQIQVRGRGATARGNLLTIGKGGDYLFSGELTNGAILVLAPEDETVHIVLDNASIRCADDAPLYIVSAEKVILTLAPGSVNRFSDGSSYALYHGDNKVDGCIFSKVDLAINGMGTLYVLGNFGHGVVSKDGIAIAGGEIHITANGQGLSGKDFVKIGGGTLSLTTQKDGIQSDSAASGRGFVSLLGGTLTIDAQTDAIQAQSLLQMGEINLTLCTKGGSKNAPSDLSDSPHRQWATLGENEEAEQEQLYNAKGLKAGKLVRITGGKARIDTFDDAIHSNGDVEISGGEVWITTGDDGIHAGEDVCISGGKVKIPKCYEGVEGCTVTVSGGEIEVKASDDGINAASENPLIENIPKQRLSAPDNPCFVRISGGRLTIDGAGDGIDSNGDLYVEGGSTIVFGASYAADAALDYDGAAIITGGEFLAVGSAPWALGFGDLSTQSSVHLALPEPAAGELPLTLEGESGEVMVSAAPPRMYQSAVYSSPQLRRGERYAFCAGEQRVSIRLDAINATNVKEQGLAPLQ